MEACVLYTAVTSGEGEGLEDLRVVPLFDGRGAGLTLDTAGFELAEGIVCPGEFADLYRDGVDLHEYIRDLAYPKVALALQQKLKATKVIPFDHVFRRGESLPPLPAAHTATPARRVHNDYTLDSGYVRARMHLTNHSTKAGLENALRQRFAIINVWTPLRKVQRDPLCMIDFRSTLPDDVQVSRMVFDTTDFPLRDVYRVYYNPGHSWVYFSDMEPGESILLKTFDSCADPEVAKMALHSAGALPEQSQQPERESLEIRCLVFYGELEDDFGKGFVPPPGQAGRPGGEMVWLKNEYLPRSKFEWLPMFAEAIATSDDLYD